jgi:hypothetical protein
LVAARRLTGKFVDFVFDIFGFFADGKCAEKLVTAGDAAEGRNSERTPKRSGQALGKVTGDALELNVAADGAMRGEQVGERSGARTKPFGAARTAPGHASKDTGNVI